MAMFDLKDCPDNTIENCHTNGPVLIKGERLDRLKVSDSTAFTPPLTSPKKGILQVLGAAVLSLAVTVIGGFLIWYFGWTGG